MVGADAFAAAVAGEFGGDGEGAGLDLLDGFAVALEEFEDGVVAAGEVVEGGAAVGASGADGDADAGDFGVDFEPGFAADGDARGVGGSVGLVRGVLGHGFTVALSFVGVWSSDRNLAGVLQVVTGGS